MVRQIRKVNDLPSWFDIEKYKLSKDLNYEALLDLMSLRLSASYIYHPFIRQYETDTSEKSKEKIALAFSKYKRVFQYLYAKNIDVDEVEVKRIFDNHLFRVINPFPLDEDDQEAIDLIRENPVGAETIKKCHELEWRTFYDISKLGSTKNPILSINPLTYRKLYLLSNRWLDDKIKKKLEEYHDLINHFGAKKKPTKDDQDIIDQDIFFNKHTLTKGLILGHNQDFVQVDLSKTDELIFKDFETYLQNRRKSIKPQQDKPEYIIEAIRKHKLLPYLDLLIWAAEHKVMITASCLIEALELYNDGILQDKSSIGKTQEPYAIVLLNDEVLIDLYKHYCT